MRINRHDWMMEIASVVAKRSTCLSRKVGCVLVDRKWRILSTGYNGAPHGIPDCLEMDNCYRKDSVSGKNLHNCIAVHAEQNAILQCKDIDSIYMAFITTSPCESCAKLLLNTPVEKIYYKEEYEISEVVKTMLMFKLEKL